MITVSRARRLVDRFRLILEGIIHGDIKPQNVIIFEEEGEFIAKLADFGYSTVSVNRTAEGQIRLPVSRPWNAPEVKSWEDTFSLHLAKLADAYSFGLLCFWLIFHDFITSTRVELSKLREDGKLLTFAIDRVNYLESFNQSQKAALRMFFLSLWTEPSRRSFDLQKLMKGFAPFE
jgi:serine/threonine protein kinase